MGRFEYLAALFACGALVFFAFAAPAISNGEADIAKHMFLYAQLSDMCLLFSVAVALDGCPEPAEKLGAARIAAERRRGGGEGSEIRAMGGGESNASGKGGGEVPGGRNSRPGSRARKRECLPRALICVGLALPLALLPLASWISQAALRHMRHAAPERGAYVAVGRLPGASGSDGGAIIWRIVDVFDDGTALLMSEAAVARMAFSPDNIGDWERCSVREWLNGTFLDSFSAAERGLLRRYERDVPLSIETKGESQRGDRDFYASHVPQLSARGFESAYRRSVSDIAALPDVRLIGSLAGDGRQISLSEPYWLDTPYFGNAQMARAVFPDGYVYFQDAKESLAVRPVILMDISGARVGSGSAGDPFVNVF
jgi:hypothetical protein